MSKCWPVVASSLALIHHCIHFFWGKVVKMTFSLTAPRPVKFPVGFPCALNTSTAGCGQFGKGRGGGDRRHISGAPSGSSVPGAHCPECARLSPTPMHAASPAPLRRGLLHRAPPPTPRHFPKLKATLAEGAGPPQHPEPAPGPGSAALTSATGSGNSGGSDDAPSAPGPGGPTPTL